MDKNKVLGERLCLLNTHSRDSSNLMLNSLSLSLSFHTGFEPRQVALHVGAHCARPRFFELLRARHPQLQTAEKGAATMSTSLMASAQQSVGGHEPLPPPIRRCTAKREECTRTTQVLTVTSQQLDRRVFSRTLSLAHTHIVRSSPSATIAAHAHTRACPPRREFARRP